MRASRPDKAGIVFKYQGKRTDKHRTAELAVVALVSRRADLPFYAVRGEIAPAAFYSTIQTQSQIIQYQGGLLRYHQGLQPRPYPQRGSRHVSAGKLTNLFHLFGENE